MALYLKKFFWLCFLSKDNPIHEISNIFYLKSKKKQKWFHSSTYSRCKRVIWDLSIEKNLIPFTDISTKPIDPINPGVLKLFGIATLSKYFQNYATLNFFFPEGRYITFPPTPTLCTPVCILKDWSCHHWLGNLA